MRESEKRKEILRDLPPNKRLFRINAGMGWVGKTIEHTKRLLVLANPRPLHGAPTGWPDLCGWEEIEITADMVGQKVAVFTGEEIKMSGNLSDDQRKFGALITRMGGQFRVVR